VEETEEKEEACQSGNLTFFVSSGVASPSGRTWLPPDLIRVSSRSSVAAVRRGSSEILMRFACANVIKALTCYRPSTIALSLISSVCVLRSY